MLGIDSSLSDSQVLDALDSVVARSNVVTAEVVAHIAVVEARRAYAERAFASTYTYCVQGLNMSEGQAMKRIKAARCVRSRRAGANAHPPTPQLPCQSWHTKRMCPRKWER